jgi:TRAP-type C4-dicarboxylate transport system permease small subunit
MQDELEPRAEAREALPRSVAIERALLAAVMALLCVITMANVIVRYFTNVSFAFTEEISVSLLVVMTLVGASTAFYRGKHIAILFVVERCSAATRGRFELLGLLACTFMFGLLAWFGGRMAWDDYRFDVTSPALGIPQWWYTVWLPVLSVVIVVRLLSLIVRRLGRDPHAA